MGDGTKESPYTREDVQRLRSVSINQSEPLDFSSRVFEEGIDLSEIDFEGAKFKVSIVKKANFTGCNLRHTVFLGANLEGAIFSEANLEGSDLSKANLEGARLWMCHLERANLSESHLEGASLWGAYLERSNLGSCEFTLETKLEDVNWGNYRLGEEETGDREGKGNLQSFYYELAINLYRRLKIWHTEHGIYDTAGKFFYREMETKRKAQSWKKNFKSKLWSCAMRMLCGYGENPERVAISAAAVILVAALVYYFVGWLFDWSAFGRNIYFSVVSFTALGYGSWVNVESNLIRGLGAAESFFGVFMMALFLVTFTRKMTR